MRIVLAQPPWAGEAIAVTFPYDPLLLGAVRGVPGRKWVSEHHAWTIPCTPEAVVALRKRIPGGVAFIVDPPLLERLNGRAQALRAAETVKEVGDSDAKWPLRTTPYAHQRAGLDFLLTLGSAALLWEMGLGKTAAAIAYAEVLAARAHSAEGYPDTFKVLVICPNTVKRVWEAEIIKHTGWPMGTVLEGPVAKRVKKLSSEGTSRYTIVNCESLSIKAMADRLINFGWDLVIVDESTRFKTPTAKRTRALHRIRTKRRVILTGTPITGKPQDAWAQLEFVEPGIMGTWWAFMDRYLVKDYFGAVKGVKPAFAAELRERIESRSYRVLKEQVLDLPPKVYEDRWVEMTGRQQIAYEQMKKELRVALDGAPDISAPTILTQLLRLTQITAGLVGAGTDYLWLPESVKAAELDVLLNEELEDKQVVIFGMYQRELEELGLRFGTRTVDKPWRNGLIYGPTPERERAVMIDEFQRGIRQYLFAQVHTGGIGINLTAAQYAVYYTRGWSLEDYLQSQDRLHRIGQTGTVTIVHLGARGTVDEQIGKALAAKQNIADLLTGDGARRLAAEVLA